MTTLAIAGLTLAALAAVGFPLVRVRQPLRPATGSEADELAERKESLYRDLRDLELDRRTGKVADDDYEAMRVDYEVEAARVLGRLEGARGDGQVGACPACREPVPAGSRFCPGCGRRLTPACCPACGTETATGDRFCGACGQRLAAPRKSRGKPASRRREGGRA